jgi:hypothetical protein
MESNDKCAYPKCGKELIHTQGRKKKKYCGADCKLKHWQELNPIKKEPKRKSIPIEQHQKSVVVVEDVNGKFLMGDKKVNLVWADKSDKPEIKYAATTATSFDGERVDHKNTDEAGQWEQPNENSPLTESECNYPSDFNGLLTMAKGEITNVEAFKMAVSASKCNGNQKAMILSKLK